MVLTQCKLILKLKSYSHTILCNSMAYLDLVRIEMKTPINRSVWPNSKKTVVALHLPDDNFVLKHVIINEVACFMIFGVSCVWWANTHNLYSLPDIIMMLKVRIIKWAEHAASKRGMSRSRWLCGLRHRPWDLGFESRLRHGCLSLSVHHYFYSLVTCHWHYIF
jgi:hypothetical protein